MKWWNKTKISLLISVHKKYLYVAFIVLKFSQSMSLIIFYLYKMQVTSPNHKEGNKYFEKQGYFSLQCGLCAVNNLLGLKKYTQSDF